MLVEEPEPVDFRRKDGENNEDYHKRAKQYFGSISKFTVTQMYDEQEGDPCLSVLSAPSVDDSWGFNYMVNYMEKQENIIAPQHLFRRVESLEKDRINRSMHHLNTGNMRSVHSLGASGIGKSISLVDILVQLVRGLAPGRYVGFHSAGVFTIYSKGRDGALKKRTQTLKYEDIEQIRLVELKDDLVMLIDPPETVGDYKRFCPTLIALSTRLDESDLKTFKKASVKYLAIDPHSYSEVEAIATCISVDDSAITYDNVMERYQKVGANLRIILSTDDEFDDHMSNIKNTKSADLINEAKDVNPLCVPKHYNYFVAPYNNLEFKFDGQDQGGCEVFDTAKSAMFHAWSDYTAQKLRELAETDTERVLMQSLETIGLPFVVEENAVQSFLLKGQTANWEWYENTKSGTISKVSANPPTLSVHRVVRFGGRYFKTNLSTLEEATLYKSSGWQMVLGDFFVVQKKEDQPGMTVYMIQVSSRDPLYHPFKVDQYEKWCQYLQMEAHDDMVIIYATNKTHTALHGLKFQSENGEDVACPCVGYIVRTPMTPGAPLNQLVIKNNAEDELGRTMGDPTKHGLRADWKLAQNSNGRKKRYRLESPEGEECTSLSKAVADCRKQRK